MPPFSSPGRASKRSTSYICAATVSSTRPVICHCQLVPGAGRERELLGGAGGAGGGGGGGGGGAGGAGGGGGGGVGAGGGGGGGGAGGGGAGGVVWHGAVAPEAEVRGEVRPALSSAATENVYVRPQARPRTVYVVSRVRPAKDPSRQTR